MSYPQRRQYPRDNASTIQDVVKAGRHLPGVSPQVFQVITAVTLGYAALCMFNKAMLPERER